MHVEAIYIAPVKSLALQQVERASVTKRGLAGDRDFFLVTDDNKLFSMREHGSLAMVRAEYMYELDLLRFEFPDGRAYESEPLPGDPFSVRFFGQYDVPAYEVPGPWNYVFAQFTGAPVRLAKAAEKRSSVDAFPVSLLSSASVEALRDNSGVRSFEQRRFRPNIYIAGAERAHQEDEWIGQSVRIGETAVRVRMRDSRCVMTTLSPHTGEHDHDTLKMIASYRTDQPKEVNFGVYGTVDVEGEIAVGDEIVVVEA
jgi:uncharacterized protein YcbX